MVVQDALAKIGISQSNVQLGQADIPTALSPEQYQQFRAILLNCGLDLIEDKRSMLIDKIKTALIQLVHFSEEPLKMSVFLSQALEYDYTYLSNIFSESQGITIERFFIINKIERVKALLLCEELTLTEIAQKMNYSSLAHLSSQFKRVTGFSPSQFRHIKINMCHAAPA